MAKSTKKVIQKRVGRPATGNYPLLALRIDPALMAEIEERVGKRGRAAFLREAAREKLKREARKAKA